MIRPEVRDLMWRWRTAIAGAFVILIAVWFARQGALLLWLSPILALGGAAVAWTGAQRARFIMAGDGLGVVEVHEQRITYFGPQAGGMVDLGDLQRLTLDKHIQGATWILATPDAPPLRIPTDARNAEALFDVFSMLPGLKTRYLLSSLDIPPGQAIVIWHRSPDAPQLH